MTLIEPTFARQPPWVGICLRAANGNAEGEIDMRKRLLRLTTAMAVVAIGLGYGMPAQAQLGGLVGGLMGGGGNKPDANADAVKGQVESQLNAIDKALIGPAKIAAQSQLMLQLSSLYKLEAGLIKARGDQAAINIRKTNADIAANTRKLEENWSNILSGRAYEEMIREKVAPAIAATYGENVAQTRQNSDHAASAGEGSVITASDNIGGEGHLSQQIDQIEGGADKAKAAIAAWPKADVKTTALAALRNYWMAQEELKQVEKASAELGKATMAFDEIAKRSVQTQGQEAIKALVVLAAQREAAMGLLSQVQSNPLAFKDLIGRVKNTVQYIASTVDALQGYAASVSKVNANLQLSITGLGMSAANIKGATTASSDVVTELEKIVVAVN